MINIPAEVIIMISILIPIALIGSGPCNAFSYPPKKSMTDIMLDALKMCVSINERSGLKDAFEVLAESAGYRDEEVQEWIRTHP